MKTFKQVVHDLIAGFKSGDVVLDKRQPEPPKPPDPDKLIESMLNKAKGTPQPGDLEVEFHHPLAAEMLQSFESGEPQAPHFSYIKALPMKRGLHFQWGRRGFGFGECDLYFEDGKWKADTEGLGPQFLHDLLKEFSQTVEVEKK